MRIRADSWRVCPFLLKQFSVFNWIKAGIPGTRLLFMEIFGVVNEQIQKGREKFMYQLKTEADFDSAHLSGYTPANVPTSMVIAGMWRLRSKAGSWRKTVRGEDAGRFRESEKDLRELADSMDHTR